MTGALLGATVPVLPVSHTQKASDFYAERLGFGIGHADSGYAVMIRDKIEIHLWCANDETWKGRDGHPVISGAESFLAGTASARLFTTDIDALFAEMRDKDVIHPNGPLQDKPYGLREFAVLDLDGNLLTFFQPLDQKEPPK